MGLTEGAVRVALLLTLACGRECVWDSDCLRHPAPPYMTCHLPMPDGGTWEATCREGECVRMCVPPSEATLGPLGVVGLASAEERLAGDHPRSRHATRRSRGGCAEPGVRSPWCAETTTAAADGIAGARRARVLEGGHAVAVKVPNVGSLTNDRRRLEDRLIWVRARVTVPTVQVVRGGVAGWHLSGANHRRGGQRRSPSVAVRVRVGRGVGGTTSVRRRRGLGTTGQQAQERGEQAGFHGRQYA